MAYLKSSGSGRRRQYRQRIHHQHRDEPTRREGDGTAGYADAPAEKGSGVDNARSKAAMIAVLWHRPRASPDTTTTGPTRTLFDDSTLPRPQPSIERMKRVLHPIRSQGPGNPPRHTRFTECLLLT